MVYLNGNAIPSRGPRGEAIVDDTFLLCFNAHYEEIAFTLPPSRFGHRWIRVIDTADHDLRSSTHATAAGDVLRVVDRSVVVLQLTDQVRDGIPLAVMDEGA